MDDFRVRLVPELGESWVVEVDRERREVLLNPHAANLSPVREPENHSAIVSVGAALVGQLRENPNATDEALTMLTWGVLIDRGPESSTEHCRGQLIQRVALVDAAPQGHRLKRHFALTPGRYHVVPGAHQVVGACQFLLRRRPAERLPARAHGSASSL